jgi:organic hydroperoxide reductase OsmC/OhrA
MGAAAGESRELGFALELTHVAGYEFRVRFDWPGVPGLTLDEPAPLGAERGPNASRLLAAAVANCLSASLLFCLNKSRAAPRGLRTTVQGTLARNAAGRLRVAQVDVTLHVDEEPAADAKLARCSELFEDFCVVTQSVRQGFPIRVRVANARGETIYQDDAQEVRKDGSI